MANGRTVLVTGGGAGLGLAMAELLAAGGDAVTVCGRNEQTLADAKAKVPALRTIRADIAVAADRARLMAAFEGPGLDILVNNAAVNFAHDFTNDVSLNTDRARAEIEINFAAPIELIRLYLAERRRAGRDAKPGAIVNVGTPGALFPLDPIPLYCATKAGLHMFTLVLRRQLKDTPVKVIEVFPPALDTGLASQLDVASQAANGPEVIAQVAAETVAGIEAGDEVILPHVQSRQLVNAMPQLDMAFVDVANRGVQRRAGWDHA